MTSRQVIHFEFQQSLSWESDSPRWSESLQASVHLTDAALSSGWLRQHFSGRRGGANDFLVLMAIVMHARPLRGADLDYLVGLGMATHQDEGRLICPGDRPGPLRRAGHAPQDHRRLGRAPQAIRLYRHRRSARKMSSTATAKAASPAARFTCSRVSSRSIS